MTHYSVKPRYRIFLKAYGFLSFATNMGKNISKKLNQLIQLIQLIQTS